MMEICFYVGKYIDILIISNERFKRNVEVLLGKDQIPFLEPHKFDWLQHWLPELHVLFMNCKFVKSTTKKTNKQKRTSVDNVLFYFALKRLYFK